MVTRTPIVVCFLVVAGAAHGAVVTSVVGSNPLGRSSELFVFTGVAGPAGSKDSNFVAFNTMHLAGDGSIDTVFAVESEGSGTTEYNVSVFANNNTGADWTKVRFTLGFGTGSEFVQSGTDLLSFTGAAMPAPAFGVVDVVDDAIDFGSGFVGGGGSSWSPDVFLQVPDLAEEYQFTLRVIPNAAVSVPAPMAGPVIFLLLITISSNRTPIWRGSST